MRFPRASGGFNGLNVFTFDGLFAPEERVFICLIKGFDEHFIAAFFPNFSASFSSYPATSNMASAISGDVLRRLAHSPT